MSGDVATRDEIRAAVAYGQMLAVRRILDDLARERRCVESWVLVDPVKPLLRQRQMAHGYDQAVRVVKAYKVSEEDRP